MKQWKEKSYDRKIRRDRDRHGAGGTAAGSAPVESRDDGGHYRAQALRRYLRQHGLHSDENVVASAYAARLARRAAEYGVGVDSPIQMDMKRVKARKDGIAGRSMQSVEGWSRGLDNITVYQGHLGFTLVALQCRGGEIRFFP